MLIASGSLTPQSLTDKIAVITGAGGGIGYEAARALLWLGARVIIAEINKSSGQQAAEQLNQEFRSGSALFVHTDVGDDGSVSRLARQAEKAFGRVDIVLNNATIAPLGAVKDTPIATWDASYRVNLRGPVLLARAFIPGMVAHGWGVFACVSSTGVAYMGAYESLKAAQTHLGITLNDELESSGVSAFTIGPGFVPTQTASTAIPRLAGYMGKSVQEIQELLIPHTLSVEAAGAGFAAAVALAEKYRGQEISSLQALMDAGINLPAGSESAQTQNLTPEQFTQALELCRSVRATLAEQSAGWKQRSIFEQQWLIRTFRQYPRMSVEDWLNALEQLEAALQRQDAGSVLAVNAPLGSLAAYYAHMYDTAKGYVKDPTQREEQLGIVSGWQAEAERLEALLQVAR